MRVAAAMLLLLAGCDVLFHIDGVVDAGTGSRVDGRGDDGASQGDIGFVQSGEMISASSTSLSIGWQTDQQAGDLNVVFIGWSSFSGVVSVTDTAGNTYDVASAPFTQNGLGQAVYYAPNINGGPTFVTVTFSEAANDIDIRMLEYAGVAQVAPFEGAISAAGAGTSMQSGGLLTTRPTSLLVAGFMVAGHSTAPGAGYAERINSASGNYAEDRVVTSLGTYDARATQDQDGAYVVQVAAFAAP